jgi:uncharacterized protein involved in outer membrane biogenesis
VISFLFLLLILLLVAAYFVGTSSAFFKGVILPRASKALNADITVSEASISPFKEVVLSNLRVKTTGDEPLLTAPEVRARYSLMDIIRGNIKVDEVAVTKPTIVIVENADGSSNLDPITKSKKEEKPAAQTQAEPSASAEKKPSKPIQLDLKKLAVTDATVREVKLYPGGKRDVIELSHINVTADDLKNGQSGKITLASDLSVDQNAPKTNGTIQAKIKGNFSIALSPDLKPSSVKGNTHVEVAAADKSFAELNTLAADLDCDITPTEVKQVSLHFSKGNARLGEARVNGPLDMSKMEGKLTVQLLALDKQVLNIVGASSGIDFGTTTVNSTNQIELTKGGSAITATGQLAVNKLQAKRADTITPVLDLLTRYDVSVDRSASNATLRELTINGTQKGEPLLNAGLTAPMTLSWGNAANSIGDSALNVVVTNLNLADWKPFIGEIAPAGTVNLVTTLLAKQGGKSVTFDVKTDVAGLAIVSGENRISDLAINAHLAGTGRDLNNFNLTDLKAEALHKNQSFATITGGGSYDLTNKAADLQITAQASLPRALQLVSETNQSISAGTMELKAHVIQKQDSQDVTGNLAMNDLTIQAGTNVIKNFSAALDLDVGKTPSQIQLRRVSGTITQGGKPGGSFDLNGTYNTNKSADLKLTKATFNQDGVRPFLQSALGDKQLVSIAINATATIQYDPDKASGIKADAQVSNLVVKDPKGQVPETPLEAKLAIDAALKKQVADINKFLVTLTPTQRAKNELQLAGHLDMSNTNYTQGNLKLTCDALDVTSYYDLFARDTGATSASSGAPTSKRTTSRAGAPAEPTATTSSSTSVADPNKEPDPVKLPVNNFTLDANVGHFYLREVDLSEFQTVAKVDVSHLVLNPFKVKVNGGPVNTTADIDLSVAGYKYKVQAGAQAIPLAPLVNSFSPDRKGQIGGTLTLNAQADGAGIRGVDLKKSLNGNFDVVTTNLGLSVVNIRSKVLKRLIDVVAAIPELAKNPAAALGAAVLGKGGLTGELTKAPIENITARGKMGNGKVNLERAVVESKAFSAEAQGDIAIADVLTNSAINIPVSISLSRSIADNFGLAPADTPTNAAYAKLPDFVTMRGTLGDPQTDIKKTVLAGTAFKGIGSIVGGVSGKYGGVLKELGGVLGGGTPATNAPANTNQNQAATNKTQNLINNALDLFNRPKKQ